MTPRYEPVVIVCPEVITGGPEAMHQLGYEINRAGGNAVMAYTLGANELRFTENTLHTQSAVTDNFREHFARYHPRTQAQIPLTPDTLFMFPEIFAASAYNHRSTPRAIWWLSVDNATTNASALTYSSTKRAVFSDDTLAHYYQSAYAREYLIRHGARQIQALFDYVDRSCFDVGTPQNRTVAIFPRKGGKRAQAIARNAPDLPLVLIKNMTREQVADALQRTTVYIDFGHQPGKDRVPREAALAGNIVFLHERGAAEHYEDFPIDRGYLFTEQDVTSGALARRVRETLADSAPHRANQAGLRQRVMLEPQEFRLQVAQAFFEP